jgi:hypothetical protein
MTAPKGPPSSSSRDGAASGDLAAPKKGLQVIARSYDFSRGGKMFRDDPNGRAAGRVGRLTNSAQIR